MSHYILLNGWMGADQDEATEKMARVFRMSNEEAGPIVDLLANGNPWQFEYQVSDQQTEVARNFLNDLGFDVETIPAIVKGGAPEAMPHEMMAPAKKKGGMFGGLIAKLSGLFSRKKKIAEPEMEAAAMEDSIDDSMDADMARDMDSAMESDFDADDERRRDG